MINENYEGNNNFKNYSYNDNLIKEKEEFLLFKNNEKFYILIIKLKDSIKIKCKNYFIELNLDNFLQLFHIKYDSIDQIFHYMKNLFKDSKIKIKEIIKNLVIKLCLKDKIEKDFNLIYSIEPDNLILFSNITKDSFCSSPIENTFTIINTFNNILYLIYVTKEKSIKCINLLEKQIITEIKYAHSKFITNFKHYYDKNRKIDILMSIASDDNEIKLWNVNNWECLLHLNNINKSGNLLSACFLEENKQIFIVTSNFDIFDEPDVIKVYNDKGNIIKEIINSNENTFFLEVYFDKITSINYIISCNINFVKSYNYNKNLIYHRYYESNNSFHNSFVIHCFNNIIKLIELCNDGNIRIWDFHSNKLLNKIKVDNNGLTSVCIWDENYIIIGCKNKGIQLIKINEGIKKLFKTKITITYTIKIIEHPKYGKCLLTQGTFFEQIKFWII